MPVTAKLSRRFYEALGDEVANELVEWFNAVDATYRAQLFEVNELNFARFKAEMATLEVKVDARIDTSVARLEAKIEAAESQLLKWNFVFWLGTVGTVIAILKA